jgi:hypothetical protein
MDYSQIGLAAAATEDLTIERKTEKELPKAGTALLRLIDYIETGKHEAKNVTHKPAYKVMLTFELSHPHHMIEIDGKKVPQRITVRVNKTYSADKGKYIPLFKAMNRALGGGYHHFVQMIDKPLMGKVYHSENDGKKYANLNIDGAWSFVPAVMEDVIAGTSKPVPVPEMQGTPKVFLWESEGLTDAQILEMWDSIFIEGTRTNDAGKEVSKNWIQETIQANVEFEGSTLQSLTEEQVTLEEDKPAVGVKTLTDNDMPALDFDDDIPF